jgi:type IV pilus assembly protein PilC
MSKKKRNKKAQKEMKRKVQKNSPTGSTSAVPAGVVPSKPAPSQPENEKTGPGVAAKETLTAEPAKVVPTAVPAKVAPAEAAAKDVPTVAPSKLVPSGVKENIPAVQVLPKESTSSALATSEFLQQRNKSRTASPVVGALSGKAVAVPKKKKKGGIYLSGVTPDKVEFSIRHLSLMLRTGMSLMEALGVIIDQTSDERLKNAYEEIALGVQQGRSLSEMMQKFPSIFSDVVISIIRVSEETGTLEKNLLFLAEYLKKNYELDRKVKGALIYPLIVLGLTVAEMLGVVFFILPKLEVMFASFENVPAFSMMVVGLARFFRENILLVGVSSVILLFIVSRFFKTRIGKRLSHKLAISFPIIKNLNISNILGSFCRTLQMLLETGIPISSALEITGQTTPNSYYATALLAVSKEVKGGKNLADSMLAHKKYFPISLIRIIGAGEKTGTLEDNLTYMYESYSGEVEEMANNLVTLLEPLLLIFAGAMIGLLAITIIAPIYQFTSTIN